MKPLVATTLVAMHCNLRIVSETGTVAQSASRRFGKSRKSVDGPAVAERVMIQTCEEMNRS